MGKYEKEIKILNIDVAKCRKKLENINAEFIGKKEQKIYVYDIPTISYRFKEIKYLLRTNNKLMYSTNIGKLKTLFVEYCDLISDKEFKIITSSLGLNEISSLFTLEKKELLEKLKNKDLNKSISKLDINPNKWIRLRKSNDKIELTTKHIFEKNSNLIQKVMETEIATSDFEETNKLLESIGLMKRSYQEKIRYSYKYKNAEIEIDIWPRLEPYIEIETDNEKLMNEIINLLELNSHEIVSTNTENLYKRKNINLKEISELKF
ncbi:MAG: CYTH domain-containing protein [Bacilli bacterium]